MTKPANLYNVGNVFFAGMECNERFSSGGIIIGGDKADVHAARAFNAEENEEKGVMLEDVNLWCTWNLTEDEMTDITREVVQNCYKSIQWETFVQNSEKGVGYP